MASTLKSFIKPSKSEEDTSVLERRVLVTAGTDYEPTSQRTVPVNGDSLSVSPQVSVSVQLRDVSGLPDDAPPTSPSFPPDGTLSEDTSALTITFVPSEDILAGDLFVGIDTEENPCKKYGVPESLVKGAMRVVTSTFDSSLEANVSAESPYVMAPILRAKTMSFHVGGIDASVEHTAAQAEEGASGSGVAVREASGIPADSEKRRKWAKSEEGQNFVLRAGRAYVFHFANAYIQWRDYALKLPGMSIRPLRYAGSDKSHKVRFFMKNAKVDQLFLVIYCRLLMGEDLEKAREVNGAEVSQSQPEKPMPEAHIPVHNDL